MDERRVFVDWNIPKRYRHTFGLDAGRVSLRLVTNGRRWRRSFMLYGPGYEDNTAEQEHVREWLREVVNKIAADCRVK